MSFTSNQVEVESITDIHPLLAINKEAQVYTIGTETMAENATFIPKKYDVFMIYVGK